MGGVTSKISEMLSQEEKIKYKLIPNFYIKPKQDMYSNILSKVKNQF
jgi:hypothetical protein